MIVCLCASLDVPFGQTDHKKSRCAVSKFLYVLRYNNVRHQMVLMIYEEICIKHSERVPAAFVIQHAMRMRRIIWSSVTRLSTIF